MRKSEVDVVFVECLNLRAERCSQDFDDLDELVDGVVTWEERLTKQQLGDDAAHRPHVGTSVIILISKDQLWRPVIS